MPYANLPVIYNGGVIHIVELQKLNRDGKYFHSAIPDVFSGCRAGQCNRAIRVSE